MVHTRHQPSEQASKQDLRDFERNMEDVFERNIEDVFQRKIKGASMTLLFLNER